MTAAPIMAQDAPQRERRSGGGRLPEEYVKKFDKDGDGKLSQTERAEAMKAYREDTMKKYDKDGDGKLSQAEREAMRKDRPQRGTPGDSDKKPKDEKKP